ncbi:MAG: PVC-type heme-binding CxxCH protein [Verrucomicrobiales bacterium]
MRQRLYIACTVIVLGGLSGTALAAELDVTPADLPRFPPLDPVRALEAFKIRPGFRIELAACEPNVVDPVAMAFDETGALFVVEMRDYSERRAEMLSRVRRLEDKDGDGNFESSSVFLDRLPWATGVACWDGGIFVIASPDLWFAKDTNGDRIADERRIVFTGFGATREKLNVQALPNSLTWGEDCRLHGVAAANGGRIRRVVEGKPIGEEISVEGTDFSFDPRTFAFRAETRTAQFGLTFDQFGRKFVCSNSSHMQWAPYGGRDRDKTTHLPLPPPLIDIPVDGPSAEVFRISPEEPWRVVRTHWRASGLAQGPVEGGGRASGYFTSACGIHFSKGTICPGDAFICDIGSNLVHRKRMRETADGPVAERDRDESNSEFLASRDTWFRPVAFASGPDGALYLADMYREIVEHPDSLPPQIKKHLDLNSGNDRGRVWRVVPEKWQRPAPEDLRKMSDVELARALEHANGWHRECAQRLLLWRADTSVVPVLRGSKSPQALYLLNSLNLLGAAEVVSALGPNDERLRLAGLRLAKDFAADQDVAEAISALEGDLSPRVQWQLALTLRLVDVPGRLRLLSRLIPNNDPRFESKLFKLQISALRNPDEAEQLFALCRPAGPLAAMKFSLALALGKTSPSLAALAGVARQFATAPTAPLDQRFAALDLLAYRSLASDREILRAVALDAEQPEAVRLSALRHNSGAAIAMLGQWSSLSATLRNEVLESLAGSRAGASALLDAMAAQRVVAAELSPAQAARLRSHNDAALRHQASDLLGPPPPDRAAAVAAALPALKLSAVAERGHPIFLQRCATCHRDGNEGALVGPDRASFRNQGKAALLAAILDPNRQVAPQFFTTNILTNEGEQLAGVQTHEDSSAITLRLAGGLEKVLPRLRVEKIERQSRSLMPEGLEAGLDHQGIADLLEFLVR